MMPGQKENKDEVMVYISELYLKEASSRETRYRKQIYKHFTCATDTDNIRKVFYDVRKTVLIKELQSYVELTLSPLGTSCVRVYQLPTSDSRGTASLTGPVRAQDASLDLLATLTNSAALLHCL
ncbi:guanine nucleotide-binding protein subunit alpha-14 [Pimephales promelas]|nr:guanine nucleotide-binding protein subunit alpha-14 [Pimephales promelas]